METIEERKERGRRIYRQMFDDQKLAGLEATIASGEFGAGLARLAQEFAFGSIWARPGLDPKMRSVVTLAALVVLGKTDELRKHLGVGLNFGLTPLELEEIIIQTVPYAGFPCAAQAMAAAREVLAEERAREAIAPD